jgi:hypothetical protein
MRGNKAGFASLLTKAVKQIALNKDKTIAMVQDELGYAIGKKGGASIEHWRKGNLPTSLTEVVNLAEELVKRKGIQTREEYEQFLLYGGHYEPTLLANKFSSERIEDTDLDASTYPYKRLYMNIVRTIELDGVIHTTFQAKIQALAPSLSQVRHRTTSEPGYLKELEHLFIPLERDGGGTLECSIQRTTPYQFLWFLQLTPPLMRGFTAAYEYHITVRDLYALTLEELQEQIKRGDRKINWLSWRLVVPVPTDHLQAKVVFPPGYHISLPESDGIHVYAGETPHNQEKARLINTNAFTQNYDPERKQWALELDVKKPVTNLGYTFQWFPPTKACLEKETGSKID